MAQLTKKEQYFFRCKKEEPTIWALYKKGYPLKALVEIIGVPYRYLREYFNLYMKTTRKILSNAERYEVLAQNLLEKAEQGEVDINQMIRLAELFNKAQLNDIKEKLLRIEATMKRKGYSQQERQDVFTIALGGVTDKEISKRFLGDKENE